MTHFLLPVGGAITLPHNCHINAIGFIHRTKPMRSICVPSFILIRESMFELHIKFSDGVPGGAVEPLCHAWVPASAAS